MTKTQLKVLWVAIGILVIMGLFPPGTRGGYDFILGARSVSLGRLIIEWAIVIMLTGGLIYSLKIDPDLMKKIACFSFYLDDFGRRPYNELLEEARNKKDNAVLFFWVLVLVLLLLVIIAIRLSIYRA